MTFRIVLLTTAQTWSPEPVLSLFVPDPSTLASADQLTHDRFNLVHGNTKTLTEREKQPLTKINKSEIKKVCEQLSVTCATVSNSSPDGSRWATPLSTDEGDVVGAPLSLTLVRAAASSGGTREDTLRAPATSGLLSRSRLGFGLRKFRLREVGSGLELIEVGHDSHPGRASGRIVLEIPKKNRPDIGPLFSHSMPQPESNSTCVAISFGVPAWHSTSLTTRPPTTRCGCSRSAAGAYVACKPRVGRKRKFEGEHYLSV